MDHEKRDYTEKQRECIHAYAIVLRWRDTSPDAVRRTIRQRALDEQIASL